MDIVPRPKEEFVFSSKWLFKIKHTLDGSIEKHKAHFFARGFSQKEVNDHKEIFAPIAKIHQMDVKIAFLNRTFKEEVY